MKELEILRELDYESVAGMADGNNHIKEMVIDLLCEHHNIEKDVFIESYNRLVVTPLKNYQWSMNGDWKKDYDNRMDIVELGFFRLMKEYSL